MAKGLSQRELEELGINHKYYQRIETGKVNLTLKSLERVASVLDIGVLEIFRVSGQKKKSKKKILK